MSGIVKVEPGQLWIDNDKRSPETRFVRVLEIVESRDPFNHHVIRKARCETWYDRVGAKSRTVLINVDRFRPTATGYRFAESQDGTVRPQRRVFEDCDAEPWFEVEPDRYVFAGDWASARALYPQAREVLTRRQLADSYGPLADVTFEYPEVER